MVILKCLRAQWKNFAKYKRYTLVKVITVHMCRCGNFHSMSTIGIMTELPVPICRYE